MRVARNALRAGHQVTALTRNEERGEEWKPLGITPIFGDVLNPASLRSLPAADVCLYAVGYDRTARADKRTVYVDGLRNVLMEIRQRVPRLIFISSTSVYGQQAGEIVDESSPCEPDQENGRICCDAEEVVREFGKGAVILRLSGLYGPGRLIARKEQLLQGTPLEGSPQTWLNLIHVDDAARAFQLLTDQSASSPLYLLSDEVPLRRGDFYGAIARHIGAPEPIFSGQEGLPLGKRCDSSLIRKELNFSFQYPDAVSAIQKMDDL